MAYRRIRHCVECPRCRTRYLVGFSPYPNGSFLVSHAEGAWEKYLLYCSCGKSPVLIDKNELRAFIVPQVAYERGYGAPEELVPARIGSFRGAKSNASPQE